MFFLVLGVSKILFLYNKACQLNIIDYINSGDSKVDRFVGGTVIEYNVESGVGWKNNFLRDCFKENKKIFTLQPTKFLIGTEQGSIMIANKRPKKPVEITQRYGLESGKHLGPVYSINRSIPNPRYFLSVGDWSAKVKRFFLYRKSFHI